MLVELTFSECLALAGFPGAIGLFLGVCLGALIVDSLKR